MKRVVILTLLILSLLCSTVSAFSITYDGKTVEYEGKNIRLFVNGNEIFSDMQPIIMNNRTLVPIRAVMEALGAEVRWYEAERKAFITSSKAEIEMYADSIFAEVNGTEVKLDCPAKIINNRIMIPVRFASEALGALVTWDEQNSTVIISENLNLVELNDISFAENYGYFNITVSFSGNVVTVDDFTLANGNDRIVVDISDAKLNCNNTKNDINIGVVKAVRLGQFSKSPYVSRVVVDLTKQACYEVFKSKDTVVIRIKNDEEEVVTEKKSVDIKWDNSVSLSDRAKNLTVVIDPGHGGYETGAIANKGTTNEVYEKDINLQISLYVNELLTQAGVKTFMTRSDDSDVSLYARPVMANEIDASLYLSIHCNSFKTDVPNGTEVLYFKNGGDSYGISGEDYSELLQKAIVNSLGTYDRGIADGSQMYVIRKSAMPAVIAELGFISNPDDFKKLIDKSYQKAVAKALCNATIEALNIMVN